MRPNTQSTVQHAGRDISEVLAMSVTQAEDLFGFGQAHTPSEGRGFDSHRAQSTRNECLSVPRRRTFPTR